MRADTRWLWTLAGAVMVAVVAAAASADVEPLEDGEAERVARLEEIVEAAAKRRAPAELFGKRALNADLDEPMVPSVPRAFSRFLFSVPRNAPTKRRARELIGKRAARGVSPFTNEQVAVLANLLSERQRRARGGELFGR